MTRLGLCSITFILILLPLVAFAGKDPADYTLKVHILQQNWKAHNVRYNEYKGTGRGNVWEGDAVHAFDYTYDCSFGLQRTARNQPYMAKWKKPQTRMSVLAEKIGSNDKYQECELQTTVRDGVYILRGGGITEMSQDEFKKMRAGKQKVEETSSEEQH
jgi:hypothetical protein